MAEQPRRDRKRYQVTQTHFVWAESHDEAARLVRAGQLAQPVADDYRFFEVNELSETPRGFRRANGTLRTIEVED